MLQLQKPIKGKRTGLYAHAQKKYFSLMLVPSYSSGKTRSIRISINALYTMLFVIVAVVVITSFLYVRSRLLGQVASDFSAAFEQARTAYTNLYEATMQEQNHLIRGVVSLQSYIDYTRARSQEELDNQQQVYLESLKHIWIYAENLEMRLRQYEIYKQEIIEQLSESAHLPIVNSTLNNIRQSQTYLISTLEDLSGFSASQGQTMMMLAYSPTASQLLVPEYAERNLFYYIAALELTLEAQEEFFVQLKEQVNIVAPHIRRDRYGPRLLDWSYARTILPRNTPVTVTDVRTGLTYQIVSFSHGNHADVVPASPEDTATFLRTFNGRWTWDTRPIWVHIGDRKVAASINGMPHAGSTNIRNNMNGHVCMHFRGSRTHSGSRAHERDHQNSVMEAYRAGLN